MLHLLDYKYSENSNIEKYLFEQQFPILINLKM